jgi:peptidoglycan/xylan/chitin deacetylase (PgdA/CDA1 family)
MIALRSRIGEVRRQFISAMHSRPIPLGNYGPVVSFCFDDFPRSAYLAGGSILKSYGARGTYYASTGLMNTCNELGDQLRREDIDSVLADGHELGCHTFSHISCRHVPRSNYESDVQKGRDAIREMTGYDPANFAYPYGHVTAHLKQSVGIQMRSCRGIYGGINAPMVDLNLLRANSLYGGVDQLPEAEALLSESLRQKGWLIFYTHDVCQKPSPFGCTPALLEECVFLAVKSGFKIARIAEVLDVTQGVSSESHSS